MDKQPPSSRHFGRSRRASSGSTTTTVCSGKPVQVAAAPGETSSRVTLVLEQVTPTPTQGGPILLTALSAPHSMQSGCGGKARSLWPRDTSCPKQERSLTRWSSSHCCRSSSESKAMPPSPPSRRPGEGKPLKHLPRLRSAWPPTPHPHPLTSAPGEPQRCTRVPGIVSPIVVLVRRGRQRGLLCVSAPHGSIRKSRKKRQEKQL